MENTLSAIDGYYKLSDESRNMIKNKLEVVCFKKGYILIDELSKSPYLYFIENGGVKSYYFDKKGNTQMVWFGFESDICFSVNEYIDMPYIPEIIELLEDTTFYRIKISELKSLYEKYCDWANWGRCFIESIFVKTIMEMDKYKSCNTEEKYHDLIDKNPNIKNRVALKDIASYLAVSPVTISRLRNKK